MAASVCSSRVAAQMNEERAVEGRIYNRHLQIHGQYTPLRMTNEVHRTPLMHLDIVNSRIGREWTGDSLCTSIAVVPFSP